MPTKKKPRGKAKKAVQAKKKETTEVVVVKNRAEQMTATTNQGALEAQTQQAADRQ